MCWLQSMLQMENLLNQTSFVKWFIVYLCYEKVKVLVAQSCPALRNLMDYSLPGSMEFSRWEYWSELPFLSPGHLPDPGIEPAISCIGMRFFITEPPRKPWLLCSASFFLESHAFVLSWHWCFITLLSYVFSHNKIK